MNGQLMGYRRLHIFLGGILLFLVFGNAKCHKETPEPTPPVDTGTSQLEPVHIMNFTPYTAGLTALSFKHIVFTQDGRAAALGTDKSIYYSANDGAHWQLIRKYSTQSNDTAIQSLALHPTKDIVFLGASYPHNNNIYSRYILLQKQQGTWNETYVNITGYKDDQGNTGPISFNYTHSYWMVDNSGSSYIINSFTNIARTNGFISVLFDPERIVDPPAQRVILPVSKRIFISNCVIPIYNKDIYNLFDISGYEYQASNNLVFNSKVHRWNYFEWMERNAVDDVPPPDYMAFITLLNATRVHKLYLYAGTKELYHTNIQTNTRLHQKIPLTPSAIGHQKTLCVGVDRNGYVWLGREGIGMYKSTTRLPD